MRVLIDGCLNWRLGRALTGHYAISAQKMGWSGVKNGKLLALAVENGFDVFLTGDRNLTSQQNLEKFSIAIVVLAAEGARAPAVIKTGKGREGDSMTTPTSRYRQIEQEEVFYEEPAVTLERMRRLEKAAEGDVAALERSLAKL